MANVTIIGAGPVGLFLAGQLAGLEVEVLEEHNEIGKPIQCAGLISRNVDELLKVPEECVLSKVKGAKLYSPSGKVVELARKEDQAYVIDRSAFDKSLSEGLDVKLGQRVDALDFSSRYIVGADGPGSVVAKLAGFPGLEEVLTGVQYEIRRKGYDEDFVELHFGNEVAPGFFAWVIPAGDTLRVGLATNIDPKRYLDRFLNRKFGDVNIIDKSAGRIPLKWRSSFVKDNVALVGDAAGQLKPTTGGGIYMGMRSAKLLAEAIRKDDLGSYEKLWNKEVKPEFKMGRAIRKVLKKLSDDEMEKVWDVLARDDIKKLLVEHGDMDRPSTLLKGVVKNPKVLTLLPYLKHLWG